MTAPSPEARERAKSKLYVTDAELIDRLGVPEKIMRTLLAEYDRQPQLGFPKKQKNYGNRRFWPAVEEYLYKQNALNPQARKSA